MTHMSITSPKVFPKTPKTDLLVAQKPPKGCSTEQWRNYCNIVRENELKGISNPEFGVFRPWVSLRTSHVGRGIEG